MKSDYQQEFVDKRFERLELLRMIKEYFGVLDVLYPGCHIHITPSFVFPLVVYVDSFRGAEKFFQGEEPAAIIAQQKEYPQDAVFRFHPQDYSQPIPEKKGTFGLLFSQYAGFISRDCKPYLKTGGILLANNSHGDASLALIDPDYRIEAVITGTSEKPRLKASGLDAWITPKKPENLTKEYLVKHMRGVAFQKKAQNFIFRKVR